MKKTLIVFVTALMLTACVAKPPVSNTSTSLPLPTATEIAAETKRLNTFFETKFEESLAFSPIQQTFLGRDTDQDKIDDFSIQAQDTELAFQRDTVAQMQSTFDYNKLTPEAKTSWNISIYQLKQAEAARQFRTNDYIFEQMNARHAFFPQLLIAFHKVEEGKDMDNYLVRIGESARALDQLIEHSKINASTGVRPPYFAFKTVIDESQKIITGAPFDKGKIDSPIWADAKAKISTLLKKQVIDHTKADQLRADIRHALLNQWQPAYQRLIAWQKEDQANATTKASGVASLPNGTAYYNERLFHHTTTNLTADEIHNIGLSEVSRLRGEMEKIKTTFGFKGTLSAFFTFLRDTKEDKRLYYPNTESGRQNYIDDATTAIDRIKKQLPNYFGILPKAGLLVKRVEAFREQAGAAQHYVGGTPDGSRAGIYYAHLLDMKAMPKRELEVIAYHEGLPGHHMQISIAQELQGIPMFRTQAHFTAYAEGWALYTEWLTKEMSGTYTDPLSDFGRLGSEMWRAVRLVVDTGLHAKNWSEQQAIDYFLANTAAPKAQAESEVRRYMVLPGQATSYKIGMLKIQALRRMAETELRSKFDIRGFHDTVLNGGALPLDILEGRVKEWMSRTD